MNFCFIAYYGCGVAQDTDQAMKWVRESAEQGLVEAQCRLIFLYRTGRDGVTQNTEEAQRWFDTVKEQGYSDAYILGDLSIQLMGW